jgi:hypothetical protein
MILRLFLLVLPRLIGKLMSQTVEVEAGIVRDGEKV